MLDKTAVTPARGRPSTGQLLEQAFSLAAGKRDGHSSLGPLRKLTPFLKSHMGDLFLGAIFIALSSASALAITWAGRGMIDNGFDSHSVRSLQTVFLTLVGVLLVFALSTSLRIYFVNKMGEQAVVDLRKAVYRHILMLDLAQVVQVKTGELLSRMTTDTTIVERMLATAAPVVIRCMVTLAGSVLVMLVVSPSFAGLLLVLLPIGLAPLFIYARQLRQLSMLAQDRFAEAIGYASEGLEGLETVLAFGQERAMATRFGESLENAFSVSRSLLRARMFMTCMFIMLVSSGILLALYLCALQVYVHHTMSSGTLLQLLMLSALAGSSAREIGDVGGEIFKASGALERISELMDLSPAVAAPAKPKRLPRPARGEIAFKDVCFAYPGREASPALNGFSMSVRPGEHVALVGPSGAGKSTVFRLLLRFYDPDSGSVLIDGVDIREADPRAVRRRLSLVPQEGALFSGSAHENIGFGMEGASQEKVLQAAAAAQAEAFLKSLPQGFDTVLGERARTLSGGQRQRLAIARALVRDAPIMLLDEATSALDAENERLVQKAMREAMSGRTTLVIAHRLATVMEADRIVVMNHGRVVEEGKHSELIARGGLYARLAKLQFGTDEAA